MKNYTVYFECYGKKLKTIVLAEGEKHAAEVVKNSIKIISTKITEDDKFNESMDILEDIHSLVKILGKVKKQ